MEPTLSAREKALHLNLQAHIYGTFAEIGAGQEVANHFFKAGAASGSVAKTLSAYDMEMSDSTYGNTKRYVSKQRVENMMQVEYDALTSTLTSRSDSTCFFVLANTIETLNYHKTNQGHGWMGLRFQLAPHTAPNECIIHFNLHDNDPLLQQQVIGLLGVNLMHSCYHFSDPESFVQQLRENIQPDRVEITMVELSGPNFENIDNRLISLLLVKNKLTPVAMFGPDGNVIQANNLLYKSNLLILRGRFKPPTKVHLNMFESALKQFSEKEQIPQEKVIQIAELTLYNLTEQGAQNEVCSKDFLDRATLLCSLGFHVIVSNFTAHYQLSNYIVKYGAKVNKVGLIVSGENLEQMLEERFYQALPGGIMEGMSKLFAPPINLFVYPFKLANGKHKTVRTIKVQEHLVHLFLHLVSNGFISDLEYFEKEVLQINSDQVLEMIQTDDTEWVNGVPAPLVPLITSNQIFKG